MGKVTLLRPKGYAIVVDPVKGVLEYDTGKCCHCGRIYPQSKHAGTTCIKCCADTCGHPDCDFCIPEEKRFDMQEKAARQKNKIII